MDEKLLNASGDMSLIENRLDLMNRYNYIIGQPDLVASRVQCQFIHGHMEPGEAEAYVRLISYKLSQQPYR